MDIETLQKEFKEKGYIIAKGLLDESEVEKYRAILEDLSGINNENYHDLVKTQKNKFTLPDGVTKTRSLWPIITNEKLTSIAKALLGPNAEFLKHTDVHVGFSALGWHRDNVDRKFNEGPDWDTSEPYKILRCGFYLQSFQESNFKFGVIEKSDREESTLLRTEMSSKVFGKIKNAFFNQKTLFGDENWQVLEKGDCIIFDPRMIHSGSFIKGPKYSFFVAFGVRNKHFNRHYKFYNEDRTDLKYQEMPVELKEKLIEKQLLSQP